MKKLLLTFALFIFSPWIFCQDKMDFEFDYSQFAYDSVSNYIEFYYSFNQNSLSYVTTDSADYVQGLLHISITDSTTGDSLVDKNWLISNAVNDSTDLEKNVIGLLKFVLNEGVYKCEMRGSNTSGQASKTLTDFVTIKPFLSLKLGMSDIQLSSHLLQDSPNQSSVFYKNTFEITPAPSAIFGKGQPVLFYYAELYNLAAPENYNDLRLDEYVLNSRGVIVNSKNKKIKRNINSRVDVGTVMTYKLPTDTYTIILNLIDSTSNFGVSSAKRFFVYNPDVVAEDTSYQSLTTTIGTSFGAMSEEELDDLFSKCKYIAASGEIEQYKSLSSEQGKREFMQKFWSARDKNLNDNTNKFYMDYLRRIDECNQKFKAGLRDGWKTDRGRIYLLYGEPSEIERFPNEIQTRPYEIWHYNEVEGGVIFIFADISGFSDYELVHSTKRGELRDETWMRKIAVQ